MKSNYYKLDYLCIKNRGCLFMIRKQKTITFGEYDDDVYEFLEKEKNASALIRRLVRVYMYEDNIDLISNYKIDDVNYNTNGSEENNIKDVIEDNNSEIDIPIRTEFVKSENDIL